MSASTLESTYDWRRLAPEWDALVDRLQAGPFSTPGWIAAWWSAFGRGRLRFVTARCPATGRLRAVLPLRERYGALLSPTNWHSPEFGLLADGPDVARELLAFVLERRPRRLALSFLGGAQADAVQSAAGERGYVVIRRTQQRSPYVTIDGDWSSYETGLGRKVKSELGRRRRRLEGLGRLDLEVSSGERLEERLEEGFRVEESGWKGQRGTAIRSGAPSRRFYTEIARWAAARGALRLAFLRLDGRALAFDFCLEDRRHYLLKTGYDPVYRELGPGKLLRHAMLARAFEAGLESYEFLGEAWPWKLEWTDTTRPRELVQGFRPSPLGALDWAAFAFGRPLVKGLRDRARGEPRRLTPARG